MKKTVLAHTLSLVFATGALVMGDALAQSNAAGNIYGRVDAPAGTTILLTNTDTGLKRTLTPGADGQYTATAMPIGHYKVELQKDGQTVGTVETDVLVGRGVEASFANGTQSVQVTGRRVHLDFSSADNGATFNAKQLDSLPIAQNLAAIIQLAPNTTRADPRYAAGASMGGGGASENAYYVNGFPVTNPLTQLGSSDLPFGAIAQTQILTGGFGAEFGRSVGGVVNVTTRSGTNDWEVGAQFSIEPNSLRAKQRDVYYAHTGDPANVDTDGKLYALNHLNTDTTRKYGAYVGGPIIQDKLFMFVAVEQTKQDTGKVGQTSDSVTSVDNGWVTDKNTTTRYLGKFDWNISDNHRLEWTTIGDKPVTDETLSGFDYSTLSRVAGSGATAHYESIAGQTPTVGARTNILKYTGNLTDNLTISALYGKSRTNHVSALGGYDPTMPQITVTSTGSAPGITYNSNQPFTGSIAATNSTDEVTSQRFDLNYQYGKHTIKAGVDNNKLSSFNAGESTAGGVQWYYDHTTTPNSPITLNGYSTTVASGGGLGTQGYYVSKRIFNDLTSAFSDQSAQYVEDSWQVNKDVTLIFGLRDEQYKNKNGLGQTFLKMDNQLNPRFQMVWNALGDSSLKVFGSAGRYSIQIPTHVAVRGASVSTLTRQYFTYTGVDANGVPTGLTAITPVTSSDNEYGQAKLYQTVAAQNLKPSYQDEATIGFEKAWSQDLNFGVKATYRKLQSTIDDYCDQRPFDTWAAEHGVDTSNWGGFMCASINPGRTNDFLVDFSGTGKNLTKVSLTAAEMGLSDAKRTYAALDFFAEHPMRNGWYGRINYTLSRSRGNTEGQTLSSVAQTDVGATETWDHREIMENSDGLLPNDRTHQIKAFGVYEFNQQFSVGGNLLIASGQPETCLGNYPADLQASDPGFPDYGSSYHYCGVNGANVVAQQGSAGRLPWDVRLDLDFVYKPEQVKGLSFKIDVFNVFNKQTLQQIDQTYNTTSGSISPTYGTAGAFVGYTAPRSAKFTVEYNHKF
ncbi:TonB-dependent receptor plug domain-containing protein [Duganella sp. FT80W]|uniref:TonB-dependent receptor plug domain-containing protein n=1 Tax=Duganella guangzhouensis TaxID=2666084 RepID=A0A6I2L431_9BURK|nr:TonB-dependent receptor [Duganella guangzhouensis]MRW93075.1 TonB-dependent receptor plug domain-containing protein [Duganella guangzhouensis]